MGLRVFLLFVALHWISWSAWSETVIDEIVRPTVDDFLTEPTFWKPELSPSGRYLSGVKRVGDETYLMILDLDHPESEPRYETIGSFFLNWVEWISDERLLFSATGYLNLRNGELLSHTELEDLGPRDYPAPFTRVYAMSRTSGADTVAMFQDDWRMNRNFSLGGVVSFLPQDPDHILMSARRGADLDLFRLNVFDGSHERIALGTRNTYAWYVDRNGEPAFRFNTNSRGTVIYIYAREDRENGEIRWRKTKTIRLNRHERNQAATEFNPLFVGPTETTYYVAARLEGEDKTGIYLYDFEADEYVETIKQHPDVDVWSAIFNRETRELAAVMYRKHLLVIEYQDQEIQKHLDGLNNFFGNELNVYPVRSNRDGTRWLVRTIGPTDPGSYYIYDVDRTYAWYIGGNDSQYIGKTFGETETIHFEASDGLDLFGYLTRPAGAQPDSPPPLIIMPHGGPEARDIVTFDPMIQLLVAHGYQVFQPNFRGSSGWGKAFADLGRGEWGGAMQSDVDAGYAHLVAEGFAEPDSACVMGASYGGYVALAAATLTPELYQCVIATSAPSDLVAFLNWERREEGRDSEAYKYWVEHIGDPRADKQRLRAVSPARQAERVRRPILLIHGEDDGVVPIKQMELMEKALRAAKKPFDSLVLEESAHSYRSDDDARREYEAILAFLDRHLPVSTDTRLDPRAVAAGE